MASKITKDYILWENLNFLWENINLTWEDIAIIEEVRQGGGSGYYGDYEKGNPWKKVIENVGQEKADRFIRIFCSINGMEYESTIKPNENIKISAHHFEKVFEKISVKVNF